LNDLAIMLSKVDGVRIGVRIDEQPTGMMAVDVQADASPITSIVKPLLIQVLSDSGVLINDFQAWEPNAGKKEFSLAGTLSKSGLRRLMNVIDSPVGGETVAKTPTVSPGDLPAIQAKKSRDYFRNVTAMANDIKDDMKNAKNLASCSTYCEKYAKRIDKLPILNVDEELLQYSAFVSKQLRQSSMSVKTMGIQTGVRSAQVTAGDWNGDYDNGYYRYGANGPYGQRAEMKAVATERRAISAEETATAATDVQQIRQAIIQATADIRRKMTQKYQIEF
jgi:hypothetical protein